MIRTNVVALLALVPAMALGQSDAVQGGLGDEETAVSEAADSSEAAAPGDESSPGLAFDAGEGPELGSAPPPDTYTVQPGDTLWDLSGRFLNNPWYWPKIWSYNPEIANPHWIFPGNLIRFQQSGDEAPARVEPVGTPIAEADDYDPARELEDLSRADMHAPASAEETDAVGVAGPHGIGFSGRTRFSSRDTFVTPRQVAESGKIRAAFEEKLMLSSLDRAYATFQNQATVKPGETYIVYKTERPIYHPETRELFGYQSQVLGSARVVTVNDRVATLVVAQSIQPIERGALLGPWSHRFFRPIHRKPNRNSVDGRIIASQVDIVTQVGEHHVVFLDKGQSHGVEEGNVFTVVRSGDQYGKNPRAPTWDSRLPIERVGQLLVVEVKEKASTALVTRSLKELMIGDRVEMRPDAGSGGN